MEIMDLQGKKKKELCALKTFRMNYFMKAKLVTGKNKTLPISIFPCVLSV